jgi:reversibly glycosylated polypeptide/UDP-arabinopyranose mutase
MKKDKKNKLSVTLVIPTIRSLGFLELWKDQLHDVDIVVCTEPSDEEIVLPKNIGKSMKRYSWEDIDKDLGDDSWIISRNNPAIRCYGFWKAYQSGADIIVTIDDDCFPVKGHQLIEQHVGNLQLTVPNRWMTSYPDARFWYTRGFPYLIRSQSPVMISHGLWENVLDLDAPAHLQNLTFKAELAEHFLFSVPRGAYFPMCSMNLAFRREVTPLLFFPLMGKDKHGNKWQYDRFDDIWSGVFAKKIMDHLGWGVVSGAPFVHHDKASNPFTNLKKEAEGIEMNEKIWELTEEVKLTKQTPQDCYKELAIKINFPKTEYFSMLSKAMVVWAELFS